MAPGHEQDIQFWDACFQGDIPKLQDMINNGFTDVNRREGENLFCNTYLQAACSGNRADVVRFLLRQPGIQPNVRPLNRNTPFHNSCDAGGYECVKVLLADPRVNLGECPYGHRPINRVILMASSSTCLELVIASGRARELDLDTVDLGFLQPDQDFDKALRLMERYRANPVGTVYAMKLKHHRDLRPEMAAEFLALVVFTCDGLLEIKPAPKEGTSPAQAGTCDAIPETESVKKEGTAPDLASTGAARFLGIACRLPLELQMILCLRNVGSRGDLVPAEKREAAFRALARSLSESPV